MTVVVFAGPTIRRAEAEAILPARYLPPASQGDLYDAARTMPDAIALIDGVFGSAPSVWHKEILWAMSQGIHVFGASSMGALRAAELCAFGMVGVGEVFAAYRDGTLEDDDEVAIIHAPATAGYIAASDALVNMRATFRAAVDTGIMDHAAADVLLSIAKATFYADRRYDLVVEQAVAAGLRIDVADRLMEWLPRGAIDVKKRDAITLLTELRALGSLAEPKRVSYTFHHTHMWTQFVESRGDAAPAASGDA